MEVVNMQFTLEELEEIKKALNTLIAERIRYKTFETNETRLETNEELQMKDYELLNKIIEVININKFKQEYKSKWRQEYKSKWGEE